MAVIDIKKTRLYIRDGSAPTAQTNTLTDAHVLGYTGDIAYSGTGVLSPGLQVTIGAHSYFILSVGTGTFKLTSPLLAAFEASASMSSQLYTNQVKLKIGTGNLTYSEKRNVDYLLDAGKIDEVRFGDEVPMDVSVDCMWMEYVSGQVAMDDAFSGTGTASAWVSADTVDACRPFAVDLVFAYDPICGVRQPFQIVLPDFRWESKDFNIRAGTFSVKGKCNAKTAILTQ